MNTTNKSSATTTSRNPNNQSQPRPLTRRERLSRTASIAGMVAVAVGITVPELATSHHDDKGPYSDEALQKDTINGHGQAITFGEANVFNVQTEVNGKPEIKQVALNDPTALSVVIDTVNPGISPAHEKAVLDYVTRTELPEASTPSNPSVEKDTQLIIPIISPTDRR